MLALDSEFLNSFNQFPGEIYQHTVDGVDGNVVFSPFSIIIALSFAMFGASGRTQTEMEYALKFNEVSEDVLLESFRRLTSNYEAGGVSVANKIYLMKNYSVKQKFKEIATKNFHSDAEIVDFAKNVEAAKNINQWVESKTNNKIKDLIKSSSLSDKSRLVLVNAIYFKAEWVKKFNAAENFKKKFYLNEKDFVELDFMRQRGGFKYGEFKDLDVSALQMPYKDSKVSMLFILPNSKTGLSALENKLNEINLGDFVAKLHMDDVVVQIPKFEIEFEIDLIKPLKKMGLQVMFSKQAEFNNLLETPEHLDVSQIVHKAFIAVNENGTEAAAATELGWEFDSIPSYFGADRPFMFALFEESKVLFIGRKTK